MQGVLLILNYPQAYLAHGVLLSLTLRYTTLDSVRMTFGFNLGVQETMFVSAQVDNVAVV